MPCVSRFEEEDIARALREAGGIRSHAAAALGVSPSTIGRHIEASEYLQAVEKEIINVHIDLRSRNTERITGRSGARPIPPATITRFFPCAFSSGQ